MFLTFCGGYERHHSTEFGAVLPFMAVLKGKKNSRLNNLELFTTQFSLFRKNSFCLGRDRDKI